MLREVTVKRKMDMEKGQGVSTLTAGLWLIGMVEANLKSAKAHGTGNRFDELYLVMSNTGKNFLVLLTFATATGLDTTVGRKTSVDGRVRHLMGSVIHC